MIKLEDAGYPQDKMIDTIRSYIKGLREGSDELNFVRLNDTAFQSKMEEPDAYLKRWCRRCCWFAKGAMSRPRSLKRVKTFFRSATRS